MADLSNFALNQNPQYLFKRAYTVEVGPPGLTTSLQYGTIGENPAPIRVKFDIDRNFAGVNKSKVTLYNLAKQTRQAVKKGYVVRLQAGYNTAGTGISNRAVLGTIFLGNVLLVNPAREGPDIALALDCLDGGSAITQTRLDKSYPPGTRMTQILQDVAESMATPQTYSPLGVDAGYGLIPALNDFVYARGFVAHGSCRDILNTILRPRGLRWTVQNGALNILPVTGYNGQTAIVVSSKTGMIGVPSSNNGYMHFTSLLNPSIAPGSLIQLVSENTALNGFYTVNRAHYEGDSHGDDWKVSCECRQQTNVTQTIPSATNFDYSGVA